MRMTILNERKLYVSVVVYLFCIVFSSRVTAGDSVLSGRLSEMPIREITVFKDGHSFVLHQGTMPTDSAGDVVLDYLPRPIMGTFWSYSAQSNAKLKGVVSGKRIVSIDRTALTIPELIRANVGARVRITEVGIDAYDCEIYAIPERTTEQLSEAALPSSEDELPQQGDIVLLKYQEGIKAVNIGRIQQVTFLDEPKPELAQHEFRNLMTLQLEWENDRIEPTADVGMAYVQRGIRWIPNYRVEIDGQGQAVVKLQATIINELADIEDVTAHLVVGVPTFAFEETVDPISLQQTVARLSSAFQSSNQTAYSLSNAIMSQSVMPVQRIAVPQNNDTVNLGPEVAESGKSEDLYIFTLEHITLKKGQRMVVPVAEYTLKYSDVYVLDLPFGPPVEATQNFNSSQMAQVARLYSAPKVIHKIRLANTADCPLTTAPALILLNERIMAQGMMTYTAVGASSDLELTTAVDISVKKSDEETGRVPNAERWNDYTFSRSNLKGTISLTNHRDRAVTIEVCRSVMGTLDSVTEGGTIEQLGMQEGGWMTTDSFPVWWSWYNWSYWWFRLNPVGQAKWELELEPDESIEVEYTWHYFWRN